jgi:hypothetical protein
MTVTAVWALGGVTPGKLLGIMLFYSKFHLVILIVSNPDSQHFFRLNANPHTDLIWIQGFDDQKGKKFTAEINLKFLDQNLQFTYP